MKGIRGNHQDYFDEYRENHKDYFDDFGDFHKDYFDEMAMEATIIVLRMDIHSEIFAMDCIAFRLLKA